MKKIRLDEAQIKQRADEIMAMSSAMHSPGMRLDANESVFFARQLEHIIAQEFDIEYPELPARRIIPITMEADPADETITYRQYDRVGLAKLIADYSDDLPLVDITGTEVTSQVRSIGSGYRFSLQEIRASAKTGRDLEGRRAETAREANLRLENKLFLFGDTVHNLAGFFNFTNVSVVSCPAIGTGASPLWVNKTPDQMLLDLNSLVNSIPDLTLGIEQPDTLLMPRPALEAAATRRIGRDSNKSVLEFFLGTNPYITVRENVESINELATAGSGGVGRMMAYRRSPLKVRGEIPQDFEQLPAQPKGLMWTVPTHQRIGGVIWHKPLSAAYMDGMV